LPEAVAARRRIAGEQLIAELEERARTVPGTTVKFNREDSYAERLDRLSH
jgi:hypothetical protein